MPRAESQLHAPSARHTCRAVPPTALCRLAGVPLQALALTPTTRAAPPSISLGRSRSSRRSSRPSDSARPTLPCPVRAGRVAPGCVDLPLARPAPRQPAPARPPQPETHHPVRAHPPLTSTLRVVRRKRQAVETQLTEVQAIVKQAAAK